LPGHGCSVFSSSGEEGGGANPDVLLLPRGDAVVEFASAGLKRLPKIVVLRGEEYHVVAAVAGHELETPEAKHHPRLKRLPEIVHLELNRKVFVNTQQTPTWRANCRRFGPARTLDQPVNLTLCVPAQMG
jgi:hypothetical protein